MQAFIWYLLKVGICLAAFWLLYRLLLSRDTFHGLNRAVLLASTVLAFLIPAGFITLPADAPGPEPYTAITPIGDEFRTDRIRTVPTPEPLAEPQAAEPDKPVSAEHRPLLPTLIACLFWSGAAVSLLRMLASVTEILRTVRAGERTRLDRHTVLVHTADHTVPFSWMRYIVLPRSDCGNHEEQIIAHERAHLRLGHSWDLLLLDAAGCLQWFNPFMRLLRRELQDIHEYEADRAVLRAGFNPKEYQMLLIKKAAGAGRYSVADGLGHSNLKKRITMMLKKDSESRARWKVLAMLPLACLALTAFAQRECGKDNIIYTDDSHITLEYPSAEGTVSKQLHVLFNDSKTPARYLCADLSFNRFADIHTATLTVRPTNWTDRTYNPNRFYIALDRTREPKAYDDIFDIVREYVPELYATIPTEYLQYPIPSELRFNKGWYTLQLHIGGGDTKNTLQQYNNIITLESEAKEDGNPALQYTYVTIPTQTIRMDTEGNSYIDDTPIPFAQLENALLTRFAEQGVLLSDEDVFFNNLYVITDDKTQWKDFLRIKTALEKDSDYLWSVGLADDMSFWGGVNQHIETSPYLSYPQASGIHVPYYAYFNPQGSVEAARNHLIEITVTGNNIAVNGKKSRLQRLSRDLMREAERNGFPMSEMMIGIWPAHNAEVGTVQAAKYEASRLVPKYLVLVVEDYGKGGEIVRVNGQS